MPKFRKRLVVIEARQLTNLDESDAIADWVNDNGGSAIMVASECGISFYLDTLEVRMSADLAGPDYEGDWIIQGVAGEFYPCKPDIFDATYERVGDKGGDDG